MSNQLVMKKKLWIITEMFYPNESATAYIMTQIARKLSHTYDVTVITTGNIDNNASSNVSGDDFSEMEIVRLNLTNVNKDKLVSRAVFFSKVSRRLCKELERRIHSGDKVLTVTNPAFILLSLRRLRKSINFQYNLLVHDVFPENLIPSGLVKNDGNFLYRTIKGIFDKAYCKADKLIVIGRDMQEVVCEKTKSSVPSYIVENWGDLDLYSSKSCDADCITVQYAGNIGRVQGIGHMLELIEQVRNPDVCFEFWGGGALTKNLIEYIDANERGNVSYHGVYSRNEQDTVLKRADISIVTLAANMRGLGVPSKSYNIMASGTPILFIGDTDSEVAMMVKEYGIGWVYAPEDTEGIIAFLNGLSMASRPEILAMGNRAHSVCCEYYSREAILDKFEKCIDR